MLINQENFLNYNIIEYDIVDSTMTEIKKFPINTVLIAKTQTNGRGKENRIWNSESCENLYVSINLNGKENKDYSQLSFVFSIAMRYSINTFCNKYITLKWPNDILINDKKCCGILLEFDSSVIIGGIGVNINYFPENTIFPATSLKNENVIVDKYVLLKEFLKNFDLFFNEWKQQGFETIREKWLKNCYNLGKKIKFGCKEGTFENLDKDGSLILKLENNKIEYIKSGDIFE